MITMGDTARDAITVFVEHEDGVALEIVVPTWNLPTRNALSGVEASSNAQ